MTRTIPFVILAAFALPALAQTAVAVADPAQQAFVASILIAIGTAMVTHANDWAGWLLLAFPPIGMIVTWLMPREWIIAILKTAWAPVAAILKLIAGAAVQKGGGK